jgi:peptidoglycan/LPS O-acetylase OafA/YrhL
MRLDTTNDLAVLSTAGTSRTYGLSAPTGTSKALPALTGLRFFAAFFVVMGHAMTAFVTFSPEPHLFILTVSALISIGMSLFFVLSGFVIHYNYSGLLRTLNSRNLAKFYTARLARLYPLYFFVLVLVVGYGWDARDLPAIPFYLGFAQTWTYLMLDGQGLISHLRHANVTWSISTEWFFYCCYPLIAWLVFSGKKRRIGAALLLVATLSYMALISVAYLNRGPINQFAEAHWGHRAIEGGNDSFFSWLVWFSPGRLHEFLGGVIAAHLFMSLQHRPVGERERWLGALLLMAGIVALALYQAGYQNVRWSRALAAASPFIVPIATGTVLFCCARYRSVMAAILSAPLLVVCGDASYAIYLFHVPMLQFGGVGSSSLPLTRYFEIFAAIRFLLTLTLLIVVSIGIYRALEFPARRWIRRVLGASIERSPTTTSYAIISLCVGAPTALAGLGWLMTFA